jgi:NADH-quinone oxidoreductase subunit L
MNLFDFHDRPGLLFVVATFLPLAAFVLILLASFVRSFLRPHRDNPAWEGLYNLFGGEVGGRTPAFVATGAIGLAFILCLIGFIQFSGAHERFETSKQEAEKTITALRGQLAAAQEAGREELEKKIHEEEDHVQQLENGFNSGWKGSATWLRLSSRGLPDPESGTALKLGFAIDSLSGLMFLMVTFVASLIHLFSIGYMSEELKPVVADHDVHTEEGHLHRRGRFGRFFMYLSLFCFSMLNLVLADNLFQVFVSWELVGICSYLLIGFYYERQSASDAANKAFITNRIGDAGFIVGLLILWTNLGTFNFEEIFQRVRAPATAGGQIVRGSTESPSAGWWVMPLSGSQTVRTDRSGAYAVLFPRKPDGHNPHGLFKEGTPLTVDSAPKPDQHGSIPYWMLVLAGLGVFLGCVGKSAQFPLQVWLPDAMEGPTPVSALIHAATMVAAGVYLVGRVYPLFTGEALLVIAYTGGITLFVAATIAVVMTDIKKVLAYSTVSQLGYMMLALGVGGWVAGLFHLLTHAFFKALLFLGSGSVIYGCHHIQDMRQMGGLRRKMPITATTMLIGVLAIAGIPFFTGWYSKDSILAQAIGFAFVHRAHALLFVLPVVTAGITAFYMSRMWLMTFTGPPRDEHVYEHAHETPWTMTAPLVVLAVCSVVVAWGWPIWDAKKSWLEHTIHHAQPTAVMADFGHVLEQNEEWAFAKAEDVNERAIGDKYHHLAGNLALLVVAVAIVFAGVVYLYRVLDPEEAVAQFPRIHAFLSDKWRFDRFYSVLLVRPALVVAHAFKWFDLTVIDGILHGVTRFIVGVSRWNGSFDNGIIDGLVNLVGNVTYAIGGRLRGVQTGFLRSYVLFLVLAAVCTFVVLTYLVARAVAG